MNMNESRPTSSDDDAPAARDERRERVTLPNDRAVTHISDTTERVATHAPAVTGGVVTGAVAGALSGLVGGPIGSVAGAIGGALLGGSMAAATGGAAREVDTSEQEQYWRENFSSRPYIAADASYEDYEPAYRYGATSYALTDHPREWSEVSGEMAAGWESAKGESRLGWDEARHAVRDAWERMHTPPDAAGE